MGAVRRPNGTKPHRLHQRCADRLQIETLEITGSQQISLLRLQLAGCRSDILFFTAGILTDIALSTGERTEIRGEQDG